MTRGPPPQYMSRCLMHGPLTHAISWEAWVVYGMVDLEDQRNAVRRDVDRCFVHPRYNSGFENDVALLRIASLDIERPSSAPYRFNSICLTSMDVSGMRLPMEIAGWGDQAPNSTSPRSRLQSAQIQYNAGENCPPHDKTHWLCIAHQILAPSLCQVSSMRLTQRDLEQWMMASMP